MRVAGVGVDPLGHDQVTGRVLAWAEGGASRYVCCCNAHMVVESHDDPELSAALEEADIVTPDGVPVLWGLRMLGRREASRVAGMDLMPRVCRAAARAGVPVALYGGTEEALSRLARNLRERFPRLEVASAISPPFRELTEEEREADLRELRESGAGIVFVGLGCPKQEKWMAANTDSLPAVLLGVGAAFDVHAGLVEMAPGWMRDRGLEWLYRWSREPGRLARRNLTKHSRYPALLLRDLVSRPRT